MKLLLVSNTYPTTDISGVGTLVFELAREAVDRGVEVRVLTRAAEADGRFVLAAGGPKALFPLSVARLFLRLTRDWVPDVVHVHESDGIALILLVRLCRELGLRTGRSRVAATLQVSYARERRAVRPLRSLGRIVSRPARSEKVFKYLRAPLHAFLGRLTAHLADVVIAPSEVTASELRADYGPRDVVVLPNGIRAGEAPTRRGSEEPPTVLFVGRLRTRKAVCVLLEALALLRARGRYAKLQVAGSGEQREELVARVGELGLGDQVEFLGAVPRSEIDRHYAAASVFCMPSTYEGLPLAILEAMAAGLPVVSTTISGIPEAVPDGSCGLLGPPEDAEALADHLERLLGDSDLRAEMGAAARERFERLFTIERVAGLHFDLFESLT